MNHIDSEGKVHFDPKPVSIWRSPWPKWVTVAFWAVLLAVPPVSLWLTFTGD